MDPYMSVLIMLCVSFPEAMLMSYFAIQFMGGKPKIIEVILIGLVQAVIAYIVRTSAIPYGLHTIIQIVTLVVLLSIISRVKVVAAAIGYISILIIYLLENVVLNEFMMFIFGSTMIGILSHAYARIIFFIPIALTLLTTIIIFKKYDITFFKIVKWQGVRKSIHPIAEERSFFIQSQYLPVAVFIFLPLFVLYLVNFAYINVQVTGTNEYYSNLFRILFNSLILIILFVSIWTLNRINRAVQKEYEATKAAETIEQLKELILSIRKQRHDFNHHMQAVYGLIGSGDYPGARSYIENTYHYVSSTGELIKTDNPGISALLYTKIGIAETRNISLRINIECSLGDFPLNSNEASSLIGNLVDNAFDAAGKNGPEGRKVRLDIAAERGMYLIEVANSGQLSDQEIENILKAGYTTKEGHAGLGLVITKDIVKKYDGSLQVVCEDGEIIFRINIPFKR